MSALDAQTGAVNWRFSIPFSFHDFVQPTVVKTRLFFPDGNGTLWALNRATGGVLWSRNDWGPDRSPDGGPNGSESQPQVANGVIYITTACSQSGFDLATTFALDLRNGTILWQDSETLTGGNIGGGAPMIVDGSLYTDCRQVCAYNLPAPDAHRIR